LKRIDERKRMKFTLSHKIFSAFMITILSAIVVLAFIMYFTANRRFSEYVTKVEMGTLNDLVAALGSVYQEKHSWEQFRDRPAPWIRFIWLYLPEIPGYPAPPPLPVRWPPEKQREGASSSGDPSGRPQERLGSDVLDEFNGRTGLSKELPSLIIPPSARESLGPRLALFDENQQLVVGPPEFPVRRYALRPIIVDQQTVGWLGLMPLKHGAHPLELAFVEEQTRAITLAAFCVFA
jgi:two-component system, OmpR family, sensor histidine kinase BaeS